MNSPLLFTAPMVMLEPRSLVHFPVSEHFLAERPGATRARLSSSSSSSGEVEEEEAVAAILAEGSVRQCERRCRPL